MGWRPRRAARIRPGTATARRPARPRMRPRPGSGGPARSGSPAARSGTRISSTRPGSSGSGFACERRWVRFRMPARHLRRRPVGRDVGQPDDGGRDRAPTRPGGGRPPGTPRTRQRLVERRRREGRSEGLVRAQVAGEAVGRAAGAPRQRAAGARSSAGAGSGRRPARRRGLARRAARPAAATRRRTATIAARRDGCGIRRRPLASDPATLPGTARAARSRARTRSTAGSSSRARCRCPCSQRSKKRTISWSSSRFGPGVRRRGQLVDPVADERPATARVQRACIRSAAIDVASPSSRRC